MADGTAKRKRIWVNGASLAARNINFKQAGLNGEAENTDDRFTGQSFEFMEANVTAEVVINKDTDLSIWELKGVDVEVTIELLDTGISYSGSMQQKLRLEIDDATANVEFCGNALQQVN